MRVYLSGSREFGRQVLRDLLDDVRIQVTGVCAPLLNTRGDNSDRLRDLALEERLPVVEPALLRPETVPESTHVIVAAHSHAFLSRRVRFRALYGAIGYHPSLLPRHRGRDAVRWTVHMRESVTGGTVFWLSDKVDAGDVAAQDWCFVRPDDTAESLWRRELAPMGLRLIARTLHDLMCGRIVRVPQDPALATWEPSWERAPLHRPDLLLLTDGRTPHPEVIRTR